jgi:hypothetical protein
MVLSSGRRASAAPSRSSLRNGRECRRGTGRAAAEHSMRAKADHSREGRSMIYWKRF